MARATEREHTIGRDTFHFKWDNSIAPAVEIEPGDVVHFDTEEGTAGQLKKGDPASTLGALDFDRLYPLGGPVYVKGAEPGDTLEVEILQLKPGSWGWTALLPGLGLLASDFPDPYVRYFDLGDRKSAELRHDIHIPIAPFCGTMGVATDEPGPHAVLPPTNATGVTAFQRFGRQAGQICHSPSGTHLNWAKWGPPPGGSARGSLSNRSRSLSPCERKSASRVGRWICSVHNSKRSAPFRTKTSL